MAMVTSIISPGTMYGPLMVELELYGMLGSCGV